MDTLGHLLALRVTPANAQERAQVGALTDAVQGTTGNKGVILLPRRWVVERSFAWATRFRRLAKDDKRLPEMVASLQFVAFACLMLHELLLPTLASP